MDSHELETPGEIHRRRVREGESMVREVPRRRFGNLVAEQQGIQEAVEVHRKHNQEEQEEKQSVDK
jgi:hypothetical protein